MPLFSTETNKIPPGALDGMLPTPDGAQLRYAYWRTTNPPCKGSVVLLQGRGEFIEKYFETVASLLAHSFDVCTFDWRGQGGSSRLIKNPMKGYIDSFEQYHTDLDCILNGIALPDCRAPYFVLAHSTGALIALSASPNIATRIQRMVLCSPLLRFGDMPVSQRALQFATGALSTFGLGTVQLSANNANYDKRRFSGNRLSDDQRRFERNIAIAAAHPEIAIGTPTAAWIFAAARTMDAVSDPDFIGSITIPTLLIGGGEDRVVSLPAIEEMGFKLRSGRTIVIDGARHEILQERDIYREQLLAAFHAFVPGTPI